MTDAMTTTKSGGTGWGWVLTGGIVAILAGLFMLIYPGYASLAVTLFIGWALIIAGLFELVGGIVNRKAGYMWTHLILGLLTTIAGFLLAFNLLAGTVTLTMLFVIWLLAVGIVGTVISIARRGPGWGWSLAGALVSLLLGFVLLGSMPLASVWVIGVYAGIVLLFRGMALTFLSFEVRRIGA